MNNILHQELVKEATKDKFKGSKTIKCRIVPRYPDSAERDLRRMLNAYSNLLRDSLKQHLPAIVNSYRRSRSDGYHFDSNDNDLEKTLNEELQKVAEEIEQKIAKFGLEAALSKIGSRVQKLSIEDWKRIVSNTLGIDIFEDYYKGEAYARALREWIDGNVMKIKTIPQSTLDRMHRIILDSYRRGSSITDVQKEIQNEYQVSKSKAASLARDQISTLNACFSQMQQQDAGCEEYIWSDSGDQRVRPCHAELNGKTFRWDSPPEMWYMTKKGKVYTGRRCHPGQDYCCRCIAIPKFKADTIDLPMSQKTELKINNAGVRK